MSSNYADDSKVLHTDLYQINMAESYWADGIHEKKAVFELFFRSLPFGNGYALFAGLERILEYLKDFRFSESDMAYLKEELEYEDDFLDYLKDVRFTGDVYSMVEGELVFANEPILRVEAPLIEAQLIESALLNIVNFQTLIATKASRIKQVAKDEMIMEFGTRRAHEMDAAVWGARATIIGGVEATSNVRAGKMFGIPVAGTHAHSLVQAYKSEYEAFHSYARRHKDCVFLVDTYNTLKIGMPTAIQVAKELGDKINFIGIRLDSGDIAFLSKEARRMLDEAGFTDAKVVVSNDLDEYTILNLKAQGAKVDVWGIGTKLITAYDQPALGAVYKIVSKATVGVITITIVTFLIGKLSLNRYFYNVDTSPVVLVSQGTIIDKELKKAKLNTPLLMSELRIKGYQNISDIAYAILEPTGKMSVIPKSQSRPIQPSDMAIPAAPVNLSFAVIIDGEIIEDNLSYLNKDEAWLKDQLRAFNVSNIEDVFYAQIDSQGQLHVNMRNKLAKLPNVL